MGLRGTVSRNTLANANATRDWRIYADFAQRLITVARHLYADEPLDAELADAVYALDATTIDLCLSVFPWASFVPTKAAIKLHTLLDLRGNIPTFIHITDGRVGDVRALDELSPGPGVLYIMDRGYLDFTRLYRLHQARAFFGTSENAVKTQIWIAVSVYVLVAILRKRLQLRASLYTILQILSVTAFDKMPLDQLLSQADSNPDGCKNPNQLILL